MKNNKVKAEEVFGTVSDFHGAISSQPEQQDAILEIPEKEVPHWHDSCFDGKNEKKENVDEKELSSHF